MFLPSQMGKRRNAASNCSSLWMFMCSFLQPGRFFFCSAHVFTGPALISDAPVTPEEFLVLAEKLIKKSPLDRFIPFSQGSNAYKCQHVCRKLHINKQNHGPYSSTLSFPLWRAHLSPYDRSRLEDGGDNTKWRRDSERNVTR